MTLNDYDVTASNTTLMQQAPATANEYMRAAVADINELFGSKDYARNHPELVGQYMLTCAIDLGAAVIARAIGNLTNDFLNVQLSGSGHER